MASTSPDPGLGGAPERLDGHQLEEALPDAQPPSDRYRQAVPLAEFLARAAVPLTGGLTAATARSPWLLLVAAGYSALLDPASPLARALSHILDPAAEALGQALSLRIRRWGHRRR
jgi:hypothetical protein